MRLPAGAHDVRFVSEDVGSSSQAPSAAASQTGRGAHSRTASAGDVAEPPQSSSAAAGKWSRRPRGKFTPRTVRGSRLPEVTEKALALATAKRQLVVVGPDDAGAGAMAGSRCRLRAQSFCSCSGATVHVLWCWRAPRSNQMSSSVCPAMLQ